MTTENTQHPSRILFFDGVCNLCNKWVDFTIRFDQQGLIKFASLQSEFAQKKLTEIGRDPSDMDTVVFIENDKVYTKSRVAGRVFLLLGGWRKLFGWTILLVPAFIADFIYDLIARNRYNIHGKRSTCRLPTPEERSRFLV